MIKTWGNKDAEELVNNIIDLLGYTSHFKVSDTVCKYQHNRITGVEVGKLGDMVCITMTLSSDVGKDNENWYPEPFEEDYGTGYPCAFCYVLNLDYPEFSEFGDCFFKKKNGEYWRVS